MMRRLAVLIAASILAGCAAKPDIRTAEAGVALFHQRLNAGQGGAIYVDASDDLKHMTTAADFAIFVNGVRRKLGPCGVSILQGARVDHPDGRTLIAMVYKTSFPRDPAVTETFAWEVDGGVDKLTAYHINSNALMLN
jgi:hypothetical protein